jgi:hypothetical protein
VPASGQAVPGRACQIPCPGRARPARWPGLHETLTGQAHFTFPPRPPPTRIHSINPTPAGPQRAEPSPAPALPNRTRAHPPPLEPPPSSHPLSRQPPARPRSYLSPTQLTEFLPLQRCRVLRSLELQPRHPASSSLPAASRPVEIPIFPGTSCNFLT